MECGVINAAGLSAPHEIGVASGASFRRGDSSITISLQPAGGGVDPSGSTEVGAGLINFLGQLSSGEPDIAKRKNGARGVAPGAVVADFSSFFQLGEVTAIAVVSANVTVGGVEAESAIQRAITDEEKTGGLSRSPLEKSAGARWDYRLVHLPADWLPTVTSLIVSGMTVINVWEVCRFCYSRRGRAIRHRRMGKSDYTENRPNGKPNRKLKHVAPKKTELNKESKF